MIVNYYDIKCCQFRQHSNGSYVLLAPDGLDPLLLKQAGFVNSCGHWIHYLSKPELDHVVSNSPYGEANFTYQGNPYDFIYPAYRETPEEKRTGNLLAAISFGLFILPLAVSFFISVIQYGVVGMNTMVYPETAALVLTQGFSVLCHVASLVLMIVTRVRYPNNAFGKGMMWLYIMIGIFAAICMLFVAIAFGSQLMDIGNYQLQ